MLSGGAPATHPSVQAKSRVSAKTRRIACSASAASCNSEAAIRGSPDSATAKPTAAGARISSASRISAASGGLISSRADGTIVVIMGGATPAAASPIAAAKARPWFLSSGALPSTVSGVPRAGAFHAKDLA